MPLYCGGSATTTPPTPAPAPLALHPVTCSLRRTTSSGYATVCPTEPASAPQVSRVATPRSRSSVSPRRFSSMSFNVSYTAKFRPTYGTTPMTLGSQPL
jgi:hypothetical protein